MANQNIISWEDMNLSEELRKVLSSAKKVHVPKNKDELVELSMGSNGAETFEVAYDIDGKQRIIEAHVNRCRNGVSVNYTESYMRRRDPNSMVIADDKPTDKPKYAKRFQKPFIDLRK